MAFCGRKPDKQSTSPSQNHKNNETQYNKNRMSVKERFLDYHKKARSKGTYKSYRRGLELFLEWCGKDADTVLAERRQDILSENFEDKKRFDREIEIFYKWELEQGYALTSARTNTLGIIQFFRYFGMPMNPTIPMPPPTTKTFIPSIEILRRLFQIGSVRAKVILSLGSDLSWRISDFIKLKKSDIPDLNQKPPILMQKVPKKRTSSLQPFYQLKP